MTLDNTRVSISLLGEAFIAKLSQVFNYFTGATSCRKAIKASQERLSAFSL